MKVSATYICHDDTYISLHTLYVLICMSICNVYSYIHSSVLQFEKWFVCHTAYVYLQNMSPKCLGAIVVALGSGAAGVFTNSDVLWSDLEQVHNYVFSFYNKIYSPVTKSLP